MSGPPDASQIVRKPVGSKATGSHGKTADVYTIPQMYSLLQPDELLTLRRPRRQSPGPHFLIEPIAAFYIFLLANVVAAAYAPIQDCDEVYNYWEPTHYLAHGYGLQTWEYSPQYAIRSWLYVGVHAAIVKFASLLPFASKAFEFYFLRAVLGFVCAICETRLFSAISRTLNPRIGILFILIMVTSPGIFHASAAFLPSSFTMYTTMLGMTAFMDWRGGLKTNNGIFWIAAGGVVGWPFATALLAPFIFEELVLAAVSRKAWDFLERTLDGTVRALLALALEVCVDSYFYRKLVAVPLNIVLYNVFGGSGKGPGIYGTEPWHFYIRNLLLNFNVWFLLALSALPLTVLQHLLRRETSSRQGLFRSVVFLTPFYLWLAIFTVQPHKEERFMYPAYPALGLNAAMAFHIILAGFGSTDPRTFVSKIPARVKLVVVSLFVLAAVDAGLLRTAGMVTAYSAPLKIYGPLNEPGIAHPGDVVCFAKEWYRFPSSFHLPDSIHAKFVKSEFAGLLPGEFSEARVGFGFFPGTWLTPPGMNDENLEDPGKYTEIGHCSFLVDSSFPGASPSELEPDYAQDDKNWEVLASYEFLDASRTSLVGRILWIPDWEIIPARLRRKWGHYHLLQRKVGQV
ncbi:MAG: hypothetical protein M1819_005369 [Sarea resinae]|nr:MAG: hypothetical protein M1819_005369 [Sarea resinae]